MIIDFASAVSALKSAENILILTHANPDGDTLGSGFALLRALRAMGKRAKLLCGDTINPKYAHLYEGVESDSFEEEFIVSVDVAERKLLGKELDEKYGDRVDLAIDHHSTARLFAEKTYCEPDSASACEIVYLIIKALGVPVTKEIASCIYTGCSTDTGCFRYSNVTARTHRIAAELIEYGAEHSPINVRMFETKSMSSILFERLCLDNLEFYAGGKVAVITATLDMMRQTGADKSCFDAIKPLTRQIEGVLIGITVKQESKDTVGVSVRTGEEYDASAICAHFGGGGHLRAAGCEFKDDPFRVRDIVVKYVTENVL
ncbi:MAG: bifunctional oligoribonuclease/PAP phosphatase NrnA [Oscillospiraceae bacterium]|nr:bifunctional oligoribonuclease/PAP phosphatase NrnA [Oscillospiraceae bacterium]